MSKKSTNNELNPYDIDRLAKISPKVKISVLKFWIVGASFYFGVYGLPLRFGFLDRMVVLWLILVLMFEYVGFTIIYWMHNEDVNTKKYLPHEVNRKSILCILATGLYVLIIMILVHFFIDTWVKIGLPTFGKISSESGIDPITYGLVFLFFDYLWIKARYIIKKLKNKGLQK